MTTDNQAYDNLTRFAAEQPSDHPLDLPVRDPRVTQRMTFGTYLPADLHRAFKVRCIALDLKMADATEQAIRVWMDQNPA
ncbi:hypothetical protein [Streptomyces sp. NPDC049744]|uniref:hypothetical protein n=1 Tax=Streptomyces sp. NPDC049744 TaxID=3154359 RepID=UPI0034166005